MCIKVPICENFMKEKLDIMLTSSLSEYAIMFTDTISINTKKSRKNSCVFLMLNKAIQVKSNYKVKQNVQTKLIASAASSNENACMKRVS